jgi:hypothetical protein
MAKGGKMPKGKGSKMDLPKGKPGGKKGKC